MPIEGWTEDFAKILRLPLASTHVAVHVGVWLGRSMAEHMDAYPQATVIGVDLFEPSDALVANMVVPFDWYMAARKALDYYGRPEGILLKGRSADVATLFPPRSIDLVFLDGDHRYDAVRQDILAWWPALAPGGWMAGHDAHHQGVSQAVHDILPEFKAEGIVWWTQKPENDAWKPKET